MEILLKYECVCQPENLRDEIGNMLETVLKLVRTGQIALGSEYSFTDKSGKALGTVKLMG